MAQKLEQGNYGNNFNVNRAMAVVVTTPHRVSGVARRAGRIENEVPVLSSSINQTLTTSSAGGKVEASEALAKPQKTWRFDTGRLV